MAGLRRAHFAFPDNVFADFKRDLGVVNRGRNHSLYPSHQSSRAAAGISHRVNRRRSDIAGLGERRSSRGSNACETLRGLGLELCCLGLGLGLGLGCLLLRGLSGLLGGCGGIAEARAADGEGRLPQRGA